MKIALCGGYFILLKKVLEQEGWGIVWNVEHSPIMALKDLMEKPVVILLIWSGWGPEFVSECLSQASRQNSNFKMIVLGRKIFEVEEIDALKAAGAACKRYLFSWY